LGHLTGIFATEGMLAMQPGAARIAGNMRQGKPGLQLAVACYWKLARLRLKHNRGDKVVKKIFGQLLQNAHFAAILLTTMVLGLTPQVATSRFLTISFKDSP
jgi:hypothetical protein